MIDVTTAPAQPAATAQTADQPHVPLLLPCTQIRPNPWNRKPSEKRMGEMVESVTRHGVLQPIIVRHNPTVTGQPWEIVAGERRWRACVTAGIGSVPALVKTLTDLEMIELMLVENLQREEVHPLDEAEGYSRLLRKEDGIQGLASADELAERLGKSKSYVLQRLKLLALCSQVRQAYREEQIHFSHALLIARLPTEGDQQRAAQDMLNGPSGLMSAREAQAYVRSTFMLDLARAPFPIADASLLANRGACTECPSRTGAAPELFADVAKGDTCTEPGCYQAKTTAHRELQRATALAAGKTLVVDKEAQRAKPLADGPIAGYLLLDAVDPRLFGNKPLGEALGAATPEVLAFEDPHSHQLLDVVRESEALAAAQRKGLLKPPPPPAVSPAAAPAAAGKAEPPAPPAGESARQRDAVRQAEENGAVWRAIATAVVEAAGGEPGRALPFRWLLLTQMAQLSWQQLSFSVQQHVESLMGWPPVPGFDKREAIIAKRMADLDEASFGRFCTACCAAWHASQNPHKPPTGPLLALAKALEVDPAEIRARLRAQGLKRVPAAPAKGKRTKAELTPEPALAAALKKAKTTAPKPAKASRSSAPPVKYRCAETGQTWTGRGLSPKWVRDALANGKTLADFLVTTA